ncbi:3175_t:CDS:10 [Ambispora leptoticha]|uniref:Glucosidase II subunit alpha n=1 Tax=Ambispora leptoticha TaxID=144679 RepID=A0A9N9FQ63_9GLOM|nr:3175_t:CDS:10 [Ambispora leptoticha]
MPQVGTVKQQDFKTCDQSSFCRRNRAYADRASADPNFVSPYMVKEDSVLLKDGLLSGELINSQNQHLFVFELHLLENSISRLRINEKSPLKPRYDEVKNFALARELPNTLNYTERPINTKDHDSLTKTSIYFGNKKQNMVVVHHSPFRIEFLVNDLPIVAFNDRGFFNFEHLRIKKQAKDNGDQTSDESSSEDAEDEYGSWEENFNGKRDSKPNGPESIALDISFPGFGHVYGIPEHASSFSLKETRGAEVGYSDPYRLYNLDVFEYELDNPMALYGSIPFMMAHRKSASAAILWLNSAETWIDIVKSKEDKHGLSSLLYFGKKLPTSTHTHWISESGIMDIFVFLGPTPADVFRQYGSVTGYTALPQYFSISYHQCRWNYIDQQDIDEVDLGFDTNEIPVDVLWLDIEHTDGKKYFTWDPAKFPDPKKMQNSLSVKGRKLVTIIDPHLKRDDGYYIYKESKELGILVKELNGNDFEGWCWPGSSSWIDYTNPAAREWWGSQFKLDKYQGATENLFVWNDMNEPSVFSGPEITMPKDIIHHNAWEHRNVHNVFGLLVHSATAQGLRNRTPISKRPFVLSRAFYVGTQRYGAIWTGDNMAKWSHLAASSPMLLSIGISGISFAGADVGGFFGDPDIELLVRWYQTGAFQPFFRAHSHIDTKRREPWLFGEPHTTRIRNAIRERYALLPYWYTVFQEASETGMPVIRPMFVVFPEDEETFEIEDQYFVGDSLLVKPIVTEGQTSTEIYLSNNEIYYDYFTFDPVRGSGRIKVDAPIEKFPVLLRGGSIIPRRQRIRQSSALMRLDPLTLLVGIDQNGEAKGSLYMDDGETYNYQNGDYIHRNLTYSSYSKLISTSFPISGDNTNFVKSIKDVRVERVIIIGLSKKPTKILAYHNDENNEVNNNQGLTFTWGQKDVLGTGVTFTNTNDQVLVIKDPKVLVWRDWTIEIVF